MKLSKSFAGGRQYFCGLLSLFLLGLSVWTARGDGTPATPATQAQVNAGTEPWAYVTPQTLAGSIYAGGPTNGTTAAQVTNIVNSAGGSLTNLNLTIFTNVAQMIAYPGTNSPVYVQSYYGGADQGGRYWGGGYFTYTPTNGFATNFGTVFGSQSPTFFWQRVVGNPNQYDMAWFGVQSCWYNGNWNVVDSTKQVQNCINTAPNTSEILVPQMMIGTSQIIISNRSELTIQGAYHTHGQQSGYLCGFVYDGGVRTNVFIEVYNSGLCSIRGLQLLSCVVTNATTNGVMVQIDVDQFGSPPTTTTDNLFDDIYFNAYQLTNSPQWRGLRFSQTSINNVEGMRVNNCVFSGGSDTTTNQFGTATNNGTAIEMGFSSNQYADQFSHLIWINCSTAIRLGEGGFTLDGAFGEYAASDFSLTNWTSPIILKNVRTESPGYFIQMGEGYASVTVEGASVGYVSSNALPTIQEEQLTGGYPNLILLNNDFGSYAGTPFFNCVPAVNRSLVVSKGNHFSQLFWYQTGFNCLSNVEDVLDEDDQFIGGNNYNVRIPSYGTAAGTNIYTWMSSDVANDLVFSTVSGSSATLGTNGTLTAKAFSGNGASITNLVYGPVVLGTGFTTVTASTNFSSGGQVTYTVNSTGGSGGSATNAVALFNGNATNLTTWSTLTNTPQNTTGLGSGKAIYEIDNSTWTSNSTWAAPVELYQTWQYPLLYGDNEPDVITVWGYNNSPSGSVNTNEANFGMKFESAYQNNAALKQSKLHFDYQTANTPTGTNQSVTLLEFDMPTTFTNAAPTNNANLGVFGSANVDQFNFYDVGHNYNPYSIQVSRGGSQAVVNISGQVSMIPDYTGTGQFNMNLGSVLTFHNPANSLGVYAGLTANIYNNNAFAFYCTSAFPFVFTGQSQFEILNAATSDIGLNMNDLVAGGQTTNHIQVTDTNGVVQFSVDKNFIVNGGFSTTGTYTNAITSTGYTNSLGFDVRLIDLQGTSIYLTNTINGHNIVIGTITVNNDFLILHNNEAIKGTGMTGVIWQ